MKFSGMNTAINMVNCPDLDIKLNIAIVDDNESDHYFIKSSLASFKNISFQSFYNGEEFVNFIKDRNESDPGHEMPDIVILDINMPKLNGFEVFETCLRENIQQKIYFTILSTSITPADKAKCDELNLDCNVKPFTIDNFKTLLEQIICTFNEKVA